MTNTKIFFDSSALFSSIYSSTGAAAELIRRSLEGEIEIIISPEVLIEVRRNIRRKAPTLEMELMNTIHAMNLTITSSPRDALVIDFEAFVEPKDAAIVAAAVTAKVEYLATFDRKHLINPSQVSERSGLIILTPGETLRILQE